jgi:hypothetical protein
MARRAALGFKTHIGWAAAVAIADGGRAPEVLARQRLDVAYDFRTGAVFHVGQEMQFDKAEAHIRSSETKFVALARKAVAALVDELRGRGIEIVGAAVVAGNPKPLPPLESILKSHPLVHTAEGQLYRRVFAKATEACGIPVALVPTKELAPRAARAMGISAAQLPARLAAVGKAAGKPWAADQKESALAALVALALR